MKKNIAIILAGGIGSRSGLSTPKQFFKVAGKTVVEHTIDAFENNPNIDEIAIVSNPFYITNFETMVLHNDWKKVKKILKGGKERYDSSLSAIQAYDKADINLIFHDAVRPLISQKIINEVIHALDTYQAVDVALPATDTIIEVNGNFIDNIPDRSKLRRGQTPQAFSLDIIKRAYETALHDPNFKATDDCGVVRKYLPEIPVFVVPGEESNMKLTYKEDTYLLDKLFQLKQCAPENFTDSTFFKQKVAVIFGGSYGIGKEIVRLLQERECKVYSFSRSENGVDVGIRDTVASALRTVYEQEQHIDFVINTAGVLNKEPLIQTDYQTITQAIQTNYMGTIHVALEAFPYLKRTNGKLIFFTSSSYTRGRAFYSIYSSTKAAIVNFVQAIAQEWEPYNIQINCINPERTHTPMRTKNFGIEPSETLLSAETVANATINTLQADITGQTIDVKREVK